MLTLGKIPNIMYVNTNIYELRKQNVDYSKVNLHYLRIYAREIGVKSPCSRKKDDLIKCIKEIERREVEPVFSKLGRPTNKKLVCKTEQPKNEINSQEKTILLFAINRFRDFLDRLEKEIENKF